MIRRRTLLATAAASPFLANPARAAEPLTLITPGGFGIDHMDVMNAVAGGHLAREGFAPTLLGGNGQSAATNQVLAGQAKFTRASALDLFLAATAAGAPPILSIATLFQASTFHVISRADKPIADAAALVGKTVGVVSVKGTTELLLDLILAQSGIPRERVARVVVGNNPGALNLIDAGRIDCFIASISVVVRLQSDGAKVLVWSTDRYAPMPSQCWIATHATADREPDTVVRFLRALAASCRELLHGDFDMLLTRMGKQFDIPGARNVADLRAVKEATTKLWTVAGATGGDSELLRNIPGLWAQGAALVTTAGIAKPGDPAAFYTNVFIDKALG